MRFVLLSSKYRTPDPQCFFFGPAREAARARFREFVAAGIGMDHPEDFSSPAEGSILGSEEFVDDTIHRIGDTRRRRAEHAGKREQPFDAARLISAVAEVLGISADKFCGPEKSLKAVLAKEMLILIGREQGASVSELSLVSGVDTSNVSRRCDAARKTSKQTASSPMRKLRSKSSITKISQNRRRDTEVSENRQEKQKA